MGTLTSAMKKSILKVMERWPDLHTSGPKSGRSYADHLVKVAVVSYQIARILQAQGVLNDLDVLNAFYAGLVHDTNKLMDDSLRRTATKDVIRELLLLLEVNDERLLSPENLQKLQFYIALHQDSGPAGMKLLMKNRKDEIIHRIVKFADKFDNFNSSDLSLQLSLKLSCEKLLQEIAELSERRFGYPRMLFHTLKEFRGMLSEKMHEFLVELIHKKLSCITIARFVDGAVYLCPQNIKVDEELRSDLIRELSERLTKFLVSPNEAVEFRNTGIQLKRGFRELPLQIVVDRMLEIASNPSYEKKYQTSAVFIFIDGLITYMKAIRNDRTIKIPKRELSESLEKLKKMLKTDKNPLEERNTRGSLVLKYKSIAEFGQLSNDDLPNLRNDFIRNFHDLHERYVRMPRVKMTVEKFLKRNLLISELGRQKLDEMVEIFNNYGQYETTCSICGNTGDVLNIETAETPSLTVQQFTNRLTPHKRGEPRRMVCSICRLQMLATKRSKLKYSELSPLVLLLPTNYYPEDLLESMQEEAEAWNDSKDNEQNPKNSSFLGSIFQKKLPEMNFRNWISFQFPASGFRKASWQKTATMAACFASYISKKIPVKVLVTTNLELLQDDIDFDERIKIQDAGPAVKRILGFPERWSRMYEYYQQGFLAAQLMFDLASTSSNLQAAALVIIKEGEFKGKNREEAMLDIFKLLGGDRMEEMKAMADLARRWAYTRSRDYRHISDHQFIKPFTDAVSALRKFNPKLGEDEDDLKSLVFEAVRRSLPEGTGDMQALEFVENFMKFLGKISDDLGRSKDVLLRDFAKYKNIFLGNVRLLNLEARREKLSTQSGDVVKR
ncbi:MAG: hypothetical protein J7K51_06795 [Thermotogae bacterium]|nr:hypothetical protein [Thermotogota bacterium]